MCSISCIPRNMKLYPKPAWMAYMFFSIAEAPCKHLVELARAEVAANPRATATMRLFARVQLSNAEQGVHNVFKEHGYTAPVPVDSLDLGPGKLKDFPVIKLSSWCQYLLDTGRIARHMVGVATLGKMRAVLKEYWRRFQTIRPRHGIFEMAEQGLLQLDSTVPFFSHSDEGRSYKHLPLFVLSSHGALGRGTRSYLNAKCHKAPLRRNGMGMNFIGKTWTTQFMFTTVLKTVTQEHPEIFDKLIEAYAADVQKLLTEGICSKDGQVQLWFAHVGTKGDLPALTKLGNFKRSFANVPRGPSSKRACKGICFQCLAGQEADPASGAIALPYENFNPNAEWVATLKPVRSLGWRDSSYPWWSAFGFGRPNRFFQNGFMAQCPHGRDQTLHSQCLRCHSGVGPAFSSCWFHWNQIHMAHQSSERFLCLLWKEAFGARDLEGHAEFSLLLQFAPWANGRKDRPRRRWCTLLDHFGQTYIVGNTANRLLLAIVPRLGLTKWWFQFQTFSLHGCLTKLKSNLWMLFWCM